jgi:hypothetical protein
MHEIKYSSSSKVYLLKKKIRTKTEFYSEIKIIRQTISKIKIGINHFTPSKLKLFVKDITLMPTGFWSRKKYVLHPKPINTAITRI